MLRKPKKSFQQLIIQNKSEIEKNPQELEKIEKKLEEKHLKNSITIQ